MINTRKGATLPLNNSGN